MGKGRPHSLESKLGVMLKKRDMHAYRVGGLASVSPRTMTEYLAGRRRPSDEDLANLAKVLKCTPEEISGDSQDDHPPTPRPVITDEAIKKLQIQHKQRLARKATYGS